MSPPKLQSAPLIHLNYLLHFKLSHISLIVCDALLVCPLSSYFQLNLNPKSQLQRHCSSVSSEEKKLCSVYPIIIRLTITIHDRLVLIF